MFQPLAVRVKNQHVSWLLCTSFPPSSKDLLLIEAPYQRKTEDSLFGCKNRWQSPPSSQADIAITMSPPPQPKPSCPLYRMQPATMARSKRHTSMTVGLPFQNQHALDISHVMEKMLLFFFLNPILLLVLPCLTYLLSSPAHWVAL